MEITPRELILKRVRQSVMEKSRNPYPALDLDSQVFKFGNEDPAIDFANHFTHAGGHFFYCTNKFDFIDTFLSITESKTWKHFFCRENDIIQLLEDTDFSFSSSNDKIQQCDALITGCESLIFRSGSIILTGMRQPVTALYSHKTHIIIGYTSRLRQDYRESFHEIRKNNNGKMPRWWTSISGPSFSNAIENIPVIGIRGAAQLICFLIENRSPELLGKLYEPIDVRTNESN